MVLPVTVAHQTIKYEYSAIQMIDPKKVIGKNFRAAIRQLSDINAFTKSKKSVYMYVL